MPTISKLCWLWLLFSLALIVTAFVWQLQSVLSELLLLPSKAFLYDHLVDPEKYLSSRRNNFTNRQPSLRYNNLQIDLAESQKGRSLKWCPSYPMADGVGTLKRPHYTSKTEIDRLPIPKLAELEVKFRQTLEDGGYFAPKHCFQHESVAIIVPYRGRPNNLAAFLSYMHPVLQRKLLKYAIFIVEQDDNEKFNRGLLLNVGFVEALRIHNWDCVIFHDVDKVPLDDRQDYSCPPKGHVRHMCQFMDRFNKMPWRDDFFGGVVAINSDDVVAINGFSNVYFGYGWEDDEFLIRCKLAGVKPYREHPAVATLTSFGHSEDNPYRWTNEKLMESAGVRMKIDGLKNLDDFDLTIKVKPSPLFFHVSVKIVEMDHYFDTFILKNWPVVVRFSNRLPIKPRIYTKIFYKTPIELPSFAPFFIATACLAVAHKFFIRVLLTRNK